MYGSIDDEDQWEDYGAFVEDMRDRAVSAFTQVRSTLGRAAERSKQYYDLNVKRSQFKEGQWVWYFNLRKFPRRQMKWRRQYEGPYLVTRILSPLTVEIQRSAKSRPKKVHVDKLKNFIGSPPLPLNWRSPSSGTTAEENEVSNTFATVGASSASAAWSASTAKDAGERGKELEGNVGARSEGISAAAIEKPAEEKPPTNTSCCSDDFSLPLSNPLSYDCSGEGRREEVWGSTGVVEGPSPVGRTEVLGMPSVIPSNYDCFGEDLPQEDQEDRKKFSGSHCIVTSASIHLYHVRFFTCY